MKLNKQLEKEVRQVIDAYWDSYIKGDVKAIASLLDTNYSQVGSAESEVFFNKKEAVEFLHDTIDQVTGKVEMRNRITKVEPFEEFILINDLCDLYVLNEKEWIFYAKFRATSLLQKKKKAWKIIHQHSSFPDTKTDEGGNLAIENIAAENLQLRDAVKRRTIELEQKNRELEIETALEKVRAVALGMRKPGDLPGICEVLFAELQVLGFDEIRNAMINIHDDEKNSFINYDYSDEIGKSINHLLYNIHPVIEKQIKQIRSAGDAFSETSFKGKDLKDWKAFRKKIGEKDDPRIEKTKALYYYFYSIGTGSIGISTFSSIAGEKLNVLKRFRNVFDFAYRRYMDVALAEAQAREAQIELALERVRARTMAMQHSEELTEVANLLFRQVQSLGVAMWGCGFNIWEPEEKSCTAWLSSAGLLQPPVTIPLTEDPTFIRLYESRQQGELFYAEEVGGDALADHYRYLMGIPGFREVYANYIKAGFTAPTFQVNNVVYFSHGNLIFISPGQVPGAWDVFKRFAKVFEQTYTRFLDLQKAEAQAREAKIEAALERVRARTMAMQKSDELAETAVLLFHQLMSLGLDLRGCGFNIWEKDEKACTAWMSGPEGTLSPPFNLPLTDDPFFIRYYESKKNGEDFWVYETGREELVARYEYLRTLPDLGELLAKEQKDIAIELPPFVVDHLVNFSNGNLIFVTNKHHPEAWDIFKRFGKVFEQTYTRFLDLQKAEAQARKAQIEAGLERVRSRSMGMQKSEELKEVIQIVYEQFGHLNIKIEHTGFVIDYKARDDYNIWIADPLGVPSQVTVPYFDSVYYNHFNEAKEKGIDFFATNLSFEEKNRFYQKLFEYVPELPEQAKEFYFSCPGLAISTVLLENVCLYIENFSGIPYSDEENATLMRFGKVFQQTYTRFLDLQKAEAQAREAKIEAALERTRTQSMIMQHSKELDDTLRVFHEQVLLLGINSAFSFLWLPDEKNDRHIFWAAWGEDLPAGQAGKNGSMVFKSKAINYPLDRNEPATAQCLVDWKGTETIVSYHVPPAGVESYFAAWQELIDGVEQLKPEYFSGGLYYVEAFMKYGCFGVMGATDLREDEKKILGRFAIEFERTYTRFLDLQKAEAQAREAQIETALEKIRSRSLAMHRSEELQEVVTGVFDRLKELDIQTDAINLDVFNENKKDAYLWTAVPGHSYSKAIHIPYTDVTIFKDIYDGMIGGKVIHSKVYSRELKNEFLTYVFEHTDFREIPQVRKDMLFATDGSTVSVAYAKNTAIIAQRYTKNPFSEDENEILKRFANVFEQCYTRFKDLEKAEAQAREAQIEASLERVRSRTMAMQHSDELQEVSTLLFKQVQAFGVEPWSCGFNIWENDGKDLASWMCKEDGTVNPPFKVPIKENPRYIHSYEAWQKGESFYWDELHGEDIEAFYRYLRSIPIINYVLESNAKAGFILPASQVHHVANFSHGYLMFITYKPCPEVHDIFKRFAAVFEQTYTRFLDLQKAEAQAREAQIEASLERVRSKTMAMHNSQDVGITVAAMFDELVKLGVDKTIRCGIGILNDSTHMEVWTASSNPDGEVALNIGKLDMTVHPLLLGVNNAWKNKEQRFSYELVGKDLVDYYTAINNSPDYHFHADIKSLPAKIIHNDFFFPDGSLFAFTHEPIPAETSLIFKRFAAVFGQTYRRFLDLQNAEAQARESQVQLALERIRARTMAMQKSDELAEAASVLFEQFNELGEVPERIAIGIVNEEEHVFEIWATEHGGTQMNLLFKFSLDEPHVMQKMYAAWKEQKRSITIDLQGKELDEYFQFLKNAGAPVRREIFGERRVQNVAFFSKGMLTIITPEPRPPETIQLLERFAGVFDLTYTRFNDLKNAEAQAREATIEAALERVRGKAMAMNDSKDLSSTIVLAFAELKKLGIKPLRFGVGLINKELHKAQLYSATSSADGDGVALIGWILFKGHRVIENIYDYWIKNEDYFPVLEGEELKSYYELLSSGLSVPKIPASKSGEKQYGHFFPLPVSCLYAWANQPFNETDIKILKRFSSIIELTFRRYIELQKSETNAREAIKQSALDRIRADIASMRTTNDLERITPLIWNELTILGIPFIRCGVFIMDDSQQLIHTFLSTPDGKGIAAFHLPYTTPGNIAQVLSHWRDKKNYIDHWDEEAFREFAATLVQRGALASPEQYLKTLPPGGFYLHFLPFLQGMLYVGNSTQLGEEEIKSLQSVADAFSTAYARYEDFNKLEAAKQQVEKTLVDLKQAQQQLVQSEKMASLGELTAGIAHEIQNPLNFVNNFSEVSTELLDEMITELGNDNKEDAIAIAGDVKQNLGKILHHGKRADAIVKGMLQHSRSSSAAKEPTNINKLADEYLRLAYHGLRAKDKSFNATLKTDYDESIGNINIIPQDIGRAILNLITNAFYAAPLPPEGGGKNTQHKHEPTVWVTTKKVRDKILISVKDNGPGIPQKILDKIFQPFFTTKPTGQGTGLGLSLSYDIIKAHGGEIKVETKEGDGTVFIIQLPA